MSLNLKSEETHRLARDLANMTGESMSAAVAVALQERIDRLKQGSGRSMSGRLVAIGEDCAARLKEPYRSVDHGDLLYGDDGLPR